MIGPARVHITIALRSCLLNYSNMRILIGIGLKVINIPTLQLCKDGAGSFTIIAKFILAAIRDPEWHIGIRCPIFL